MGFCLALSLTIKKIKIQPFRALQFTEIAYQSPQSWQLPREQQSNFTSAHQ